MTHLACPKCRQLVSDDALDAGQCPYCGYDGAMVTTPSAKGAWLLATIAVVIGGLCISAYLLFPRPDTTRHAPAHEFAAVVPAAHAQPQMRIEPGIAPTPRLVQPVVRSDPEPPQPMPVVAGPPKFNPWNPGAMEPGPTVRINPKEVREKQIDIPRGMVTIPDMNGQDRLVLTGQVKVLKLGSVNGEAILDASGLQADEVIITGDINGNTVVKLNAPAGKVTIGGLVIGSAKLTVNAPGGEMFISAGSGRLGGGATVTVLTRRLEVNGLLNEGAKVAVTITAGGSLKVAAMDGGAKATYKKAAPSDPEPKIETGELRNGTTVIRER